MVTGDRIDGRQAFVNFNSAEEVKNRASFERNHMRGHADIALAA